MASVACGDLRDVPDDRALGIKVHCSDQEQAPFCVLRGNLIEHVLGHILFDEVVQGRRIGHRISKNRRVEVPFGEEVLLRHAGIEQLQFRVVVLPQECKRRGECAGANAGHQLELRPRPGL